MTDASLLSRELDLSQPADEFSPKQYLDLEQGGEDYPFFRQHRLAMRPDTDWLLLLNRWTGEELWEQKLEETHLGRLAQGRAQPVRRP